MFSEFNISLSKGDLQELEIEVRYYGLSEAYTLAREILTPTIAATSVNSNTWYDRNCTASFTVGDRVLPPSPNSIIKLNVGGARFITTYSTINNVDGLLSALLSGPSIAPDTEGYHFIDRDGKLFRHIFNLLRFPREFEVHLPKDRLLELEKEVDYYGLSEAYALARERRTPAITATSNDAGPNYGHTFTAYFKVGDRVLLASNRGWNVLLFDPRNNTVISQTCHDTAEDPQAAQRCADVLNAAPTGTIVAIAVFGNGGGYNDPEVDKELHRALQGCGAAS
ncbi:BTB/POZ protein, partial [Ochromonadaceae sp. CCMP2298]